MGEPQDPGPLNFAPVGPAQNPGAPIPQPAAGEPARPGVPPPPPGSWSVRDPKPIADPLSQLPNTWAPPPPPPPPDAPPFLQVTRTGKLAVPESKVSVRSAIAIIATTVVVAAAGITVIATRSSTPVAQVATKHTTSTTFPSFNASALGLTAHASASASDQPLPTATPQSPPAAAPQPLSALPTGQVIGGVGSSQPISLMT